ncbi:MAG: TonB-dependent receptor [Bacteroidaceae bacterium]|nr:TonB-dependent receptor [Bacteroidaceae bacterium]
MVKRFLASCLLLSSMGMMAQSQQDGLKEIDLDEVSVVSTRAGEKTPIAYTNVSKEQIANLNSGKDLPFLLSTTPSVTLSSDAGNGIGYTSIRMRGADPSRINITANGIPLNDAESSTVFWVNMPDFASSADNIQIQRGVGTSTNGAGAFGGTMNIQTAKLTKEPTLGVDVSGGSYGTNKETLKFSTGWLGNHWAMQGRLSHIASDGYIDRAQTKLNSYFLQGAYAGRNSEVKFITFNGQEKTYHAWNYSSKYEQSLYGRTYNSCGEYWDADGNQHYYNGQTDNYHQQNYQLLWNQTLTHVLNMNVGLHYTKGQGYYEQYQAGTQWMHFGMSTDPDFYEDLADQQKMDNDFYGMVASLTYDNHKNASMNLGGGWNQYEGDQFGKIVWAKPGVATTMSETAALTPDFEYYRNHARKSDFNVYGKVNYEMVKGVNAFVDLQYRHVMYKMQDPTVAYGVNKNKHYVIDNHYDFFNPKVGINYDITSQHKVYASYGIGHKEPVRNNFMQQIANPDNDDAKAKAEMLGDLEGGYKFQSSHFSAGANIYWMHYKDQLVLTGELNAIGEALTKNLSRSYRLGVELEAAWKPVDWFRWDINATLSRNRVQNINVTLDDGSTESIGTQPLAFSPDVIFNNNFTFAWRGLTASVQTQYIGEQYLTNTGFKTFRGWDADGNATCETLMLDDIFTTNLDVTYQFKAKSLGIKDATIGMTLYNLFSAKFENNGWAAPAYTKDGDQVIAYNPNYATYGALRDCWAVGFAPQAPFHFMAHLSLNF